VNRITIALSKGRIFDETLPLLNAAGIVPSEDPETSRRLIMGTNRTDVNLVIVRASDVTVYSIGFLENQPSSVRAEQRLRLSQLATESGGEAFFPYAERELARALGELAHGVTFAVGWKRARMTPSAASSSPTWVVTFARP